MSMTVALPLIFLIVLAAPLIVGLATYNRLVALDQRCETALSDVDAHLKHRQNLIPAIVETVRGFTAHELEILTRVAESRVRALNATAPESRFEAEKHLAQNIDVLLAVAERFPDIKSSSHFHQLREELTDAENRITASRRFYNLAVEEYDATLRQFPGNLIARLKPMSLRTPFDLGVERAIIDDPIAIRL